MSKRGKLICVEGIDGSGKSTVVRKVVEELVRNYSIATAVTREPTNGPIGKLIREYLNGVKTARDPYTIQLLMRADRLEHLADNGIGIRKMLNGGINVICDRFMLSSVVYGTYQSCPTVDLGLENEDYLTSETQMQKSYNDIYEEHKSFVQSVSQELNANLTELIRCPENDLINDMYTIHLIVSPDVAIERINKRSSETGESISIYEDKEKLEKLFNTYNVATQLLRGSGFNVIDVNAAKDEDEVYKEVLSHIKNIISL